MTAPALTQTTEPNRPPAPNADSLAVLFDRDCGFCQWTVRQLRSLDRHRRLRFVSLQDARAGTGGPALEEVARTYPLERAIHVVAGDGSVRAGGRAMLRILDALPGGPILRPWAALPGVEPLVEGLYSVLARNRNGLGRLVAASDEVPACVIDPLDAPIPPV